MSKRITKITSRILLLPLLIMLNACVAGITLRKEALKTMQSVSIQKNVSKPETIGVYGGQETFAALTGFLTAGVVGAVAASEIPKKRGPLMVYVMDKAGIDLGEIVREEFVNQFKGCGFPCPLVEEQGDAEFKLQIIGAGFAKPAGFTGNLQPELVVDASLVAQDGSILWKSRKVVTQGIKQTPRHKYEEYVNNPEMIREAFSIAVRIVIEKLLKDLRK